MWEQLYSWEGMWIGVPLSALGHKVDLPVYPLGPRYYVLYIDVLPCI